LHQLDQGAVLSLDQHQGRLLAATTVGLYVGTQVNGAWQWTPRHGPGSPHSSIIIGLLPVGNLLLVSTATDGLWKLEQWVSDTNYSWSQVGNGIESILTFH
jgi:hypothetical protein